MNRSMYRMSLDIREVSSQAILEVNRYDTARRLVITLTDNGAPYHIADGCFANFTAKKPDNTYLNNSCIIEGNTIIYDFTEQTAIVAGDMACEIVLYGADGNRITSPSFTIYVDPTVYDGEAIKESASEMTALNKLVTQANAVVVEGNDLIETLEVKLANGDFNGKDGKDAESGANALKGYASGTAVRMDDVSPTQHDVVVKVHNIDPSTIALTAHGKNLIPYPYQETSKTVNGITYTVNGDGTITANGTATQTSNCFLFKKFYVGAGRTMISGCPKGGDYVTYRITCDCFKGSSDIGSVTDIGSGISLPTDCDTVYPYITIFAGVTVSNLVFKPQVEKGNSVTNYEMPKNSETYTPSADGSVEIHSVHPTMTILADSEDAVIECEYNRDANKVVAELLDLIQRIAEKEDYITLLANKWVATSVSGRYEQVVAVDGVTPKSTVIMDLSLAQAETFRAKDLSFFLAPGDGVVTVYAIGQKPTNDYTLRVRYKEAI